MDPEEVVRKTRLFLFDVDGVFLAGKKDVRLLSGRRIIRELRERGLPFRLVTNTSTHGPGFLADTMTQHGIEISPEEVHSALETTVQATAQRFPGGRCFVVGEPGMHDRARAAGLSVIDTLPADVVLMGLSRFVDYDVLTQAARCLRGGAALLACHRNKMWLDDSGPGLSCGAWLAALEFATGCTAEIFGKPTRAFFEAACKPAGIPPEHTLMVGDDPRTDVRGAQEAGMRAALALSGKTSREDLGNIDAKPDLILDQVDDLVELLPASRAT